MTKENIIQATIECERGELNFNNGNNRSFLFNNKWFPLRAILNKAAAIANEPNNLTTDEAMKILVYKFPYVKIKDINFENNNLVELNTEEKFSEINTLSKMINQLTQ